MQILFESEHLLVVLKPAGWTVEHSNYYHSVEDWAWTHVKKQVKKPFIGVVHRLDRPVSGVLLLAKKKIALKQLNEQFREGKVRKTYLAIVKNEPPSKSEKIRHWLVKEKQNKKAIVYPQAVAQGVEVMLHYRLLEKRRTGYLLEIHPYSGKFHQIRAQLAAIGCPIVGDEKYGGGNSPVPGSIALHAYRLSIDYPLQTESFSFVAPLPENELWETGSR